LPTRATLAALLTLTLAACTGAPEATTAEDDGRAVIDQTPPTPPQRVAPPTPIRQRVRIMAVGDIMLGTDYPSDRLPPDDHPGILAGVAQLLDDADITFGNLEGVMMDGGQPFKRCADPA